MPSREDFLENFAGDLEYHPRRAAVYFAFAATAACTWIFSAPENKFTAFPLICVLGSLALTGKAIFLLRRSSEGIGMSDAELRELSSPEKRKKLPSLPEQAAQMVQDFGTGSLLLWPLLNMGVDIDQSWSHPPRGPILLCGSVLFGLGWLIRRLIHKENLAG